MNKIYIKKIKDLELELLDPKVRKDKKRLSQLLSEDFMEIASSGVIFNKEDILKNLPKQNNIEWKVSNLKVKEISQNIFLINYKIKKTDIKNNIVTNSIRTSLWKDFNGNWKMVFHQGTLIK